MLEKIKNGAVINVGYQKFTAPFSYSTNDSFNPIGYSVDLFEMALKKIEDELNLPKSTINPIEVTSTTRLEKLNSYDIDIECGSTTPTANREKDSLFSRPIFYTSHKIILKKSSVNKIKARDQLHITGIEGSTSYLNLLKTNFNFIFSGKSSIISSFNFFKDSESVDGMIADEVILKSLFLESGSDDFIILPNSYGGEMYGFMIRHEDSDFKVMMDGALNDIFQSECFIKLYNKWFYEPIPELGFNLKIGLSSEIKEKLQIRKLLSN